MTEQFRPVISTLNSEDATYLVCRAFLTSGARPGELTLDVGCGDGDLLTALVDLGCEVRGTEITPELVEDCRRKGLDVSEGFAESLPFEDSRFDRIVCSVVLPYTDERKAIAEWARVLKPGGRVYATCHGLGYGLNYMLRGSDIRQRAYGLRMLANTYLLWASGRRLPGFAGDTCCQGQRRLREYYAEYGLVLEREAIASTCLGQPRFICHQLRKPEAAAAEFAQPVLQRAEEQEYPQKRAG